MVPGRLVGDGGAARKKRLLIRCECRLDVTGMVAQRQAQLGAILDGAKPSSAPSRMARLAPSPENGDIRWAASPTSVTPGTRFHRWSIGKAWMGRTMGGVSLSATKARSGGAQPSNSLARRRNAAAGWLKSMAPIHACGLFNAT